MQVRAMVVSTDEPPVSFDIHLLYEDNQLIVVDKPADLPVHPAGKYYQHTLLAWLHQQWPTLPVFHLITRLDRETAGVVLIAKTASAAKHFQKVPKRKVYRALVEGQFPQGPFYCAGTLARVETAAVRKRLTLLNPQCALEPLPIPEGNMGAETKFYRLGVGPWEGTSELAAELLTGRTHQIRATLQTLGYPVVGDKIYGRDETYFLRFIEDALTESDRLGLRIQHQALWAYRLSCEDFSFVSDRQLW